MLLSTDRSCTEILELDDPQTEWALDVLSDYVIDDDTNVPKVLRERI